MWKSHRNVYGEHIDYLKTHVNNPYKYLMIKYTEKIRTISEYKKYLQTPIMRVQYSLEADYDKCNKVVLEKVIRKAIRNGLHETMQDKLKLKDSDYHMSSDERLSEYLDTIDHNGMRRRETQKRARDKLKYSSGSNDDSHSSSGRIPNKVKKEAKKISQGEARLFSLCKRAGMPYYKYYSHSDSSCNDVEYTKKNIRGSIADHNSVTRSFKNQETSWKKEIKRAHMNTNKFYKKLSQDLKKSELKRIAKNMEDSSDSDSDSDSESETIIKQEIRRSDPQEKPDYKKRTVEKYFGFRKPHIDPNTGDWIWESPYHHQ